MYKSYVQRLKVLLPSLIKFIDVTRSIAQKKKSLLSSYGPAQLNIS